MFDLRRACEHGQLIPHMPADWWMDQVGCPGGRPATVADLVSALRAEGILVVEKEKHKARLDWPYWATVALEKLIYHDKSWPGSIRMLDAIEKAQAGIKK